MSLTSLGYVLFLIACVFVYWLVPETWRRGVLLLASVGFYLAAMPGQLPVMLVYLWIVYALGVTMAKSKKKKARTLLIFGIAVSLGYLFFYKYLNFALSAFTHRRRTLSLVVPMGISYITFQCISYLTMVYRRETRALANPTLVFLYALFFPKVTAGPIEPPDTFFAGLKNKPRLNWRDTLSAVTVIAVGFAKKCAVADLAAPVVNAVFQRPGQADGLSTLAAIALYTVQIYFDFSGYTDIALGSARLFGINLTENFDHPYSAASIVDFWRRWHISLTNWLRKYVYFPLGGSRVAPSRHCLNVMITFLVSGLWHGASMTFVVWGLLHGVGQVIEIAFGKSSRKKKPSKGKRIAGRIRTVALVAVGWVFFRADSLGGAFRVLGGLFGGWTAAGQTLAAAGLGVGAWIILLLTAFGAGRIKDYARSKAMTQRGAVLCCVALTVVTMIAVAIGAGQGASNSFIYFNF